MSRSQKFRFYCVQNNAWIKYKIYPNVVENPPKKILKVIYPNSKEVNLGTRLAPNISADHPTVNWEGVQKEYYTLLMSDLDNRRPSRGELLHWLLGNVQGNKIKKTNVLAKYLPPCPDPESGIHRYIFLLFMQPKFLKFEKLNNRNDFSITNFMERYNLGRPVAGNFFLCSNEPLYIASQ